MNMPFNRFPFLKVLFLAVLLTPSLLRANGIITLSVEKLPDFREVRPGMRSDVQFYYVGGTELSQDLVISVEGEFSISLDCNEGFTNSISLVPSNGSIASSRIYVRFFPETTGPKEGRITHISGSATPLNLSLSGQGMGNPVPQGYYSQATAVGSQLKTQLHNIIKDHQVQTYLSLWAHFEQTDATFAGKVWDMYSDTPCEEPPYVYNFVEDQDRGLGGNSEGDVFNREHSMPRSWFGGQIDPMHTDLFHIWPVDKFVNARRADFPYGEVNNPTWISQNGGKLGPNSLSGYSGIAFEPIDEYKGDIARGFLYMVTRYEDLIETWTYNSSGMAMLDNQKYPGYKPWAISMLMEWHRKDPVSQKEILRNQAIYQIQGNRNPFIDHPEFVDRIWGDTLAYVGIAQVKEGFGVFPNPSSGRLTIDAPQGAKTLELYSMCGKLILTKQLDQARTSLSTARLTPGVYLLLLHSEKAVFREKIIIKSY